MQEVELMLNAGDEGVQMNWLVYPQSLDSNTMQEVLNIADAKFRETFWRDGHKMFEDIEKEIQSNNAYPNPTKYKTTSEWHYTQLVEGAVIYRFGFDGRRETRSNRANSSIEGAFLKGIDIVRTIKKYGPSIIEEIGEQLPDDIERILVAKNFDIFKELYREYETQGKMDSLYNHFYVACKGREISVSKNIQVRPLIKLGPLSKIFK